MQFNGGGSPLKVLVVEDDKPSRMVLRHILTKAGGVEITEAFDGVEAWELLDEGHRPDLCFLDINMPRMDGLELLRNIRADPSKARIKVCFCSAIRDRSLVGQACTTKPDFYVLKPFSPQTILQVLNKVRLPSGTQGPLESFEQVCSRLNVTVETYNDSLQKFIEKIEELKLELTSRFMKQDIESACVMLEGAKLHAQQVGAHRLYKTLDNLTAAFRPNARIPGPLPTSPDEFLGIFADELMKGMQHIHEELESVKAASQRLAAQMQAAKEGSASTAGMEKLELTALAREIKEVLRRGRLLSFEKNARVKPLEISIRPPLVGGASEERFGLVTRKTSFRLAIPDRETSQAVEECRKCTDLTKAFSISVEPGVRWITDKGVPLFMRELNRRNEHGVGLIKRAVGDDLETYLEKQAAAVREHLATLLKEGGKDCLPSEDQIQEIVASIRERLEPALQGTLVSPPVFTPGNFEQVADPDSDSSWAAALELLESCAAIFRSSPETMAGGSGFISIVPQEFRTAMNLFDDCLGRTPDTKRAAAELKEVRRIVGSEGDLREKCRLLRRLIRGAGETTPAGAATANGATTMT